MTATTDTPARQKTWRRLWKTFGPDLWRHRRKLVLAYLLSLISIGATVLSPWPLKSIIDHVISQQPFGWSLQHLTQGISSDGMVVLLSLSFVLLALIAALTGAANKIMIAQVRERLSLELRDKILVHIQKLPPSMRTAFKSGELVMRLVGDVNLFTRLQTKTLPVIFRHVYMMIFTLAMMFWIEPRLALLGLMVIPGLAFLAKRYGGPLKNSSRKKRHHEGDVAGLAQEIVNGLPTIQAIGSESYTRKRFEHTNARSLESGVRMIGVIVGMERTLQVAQGVAVALVTGGGALLVLRGQLTVGELTVFAAYMTQLLKPVEKINELASSVARGFAAVEKLLGLLETRPAVREISAGATISAVKGNFSLQNIWFYYPDAGVGSAPVLRGLNLKLVPGKLTVLVGSSGCGKSTLLHLLLRLYDPSLGQILLDGCPLKEMSLQSLRAQISVLLQTTHLFAGTIREALAAHTKEVSDNQLWDALAFVGLERFVRKLPAGLNAPLGEDAFNFSGGQRKRLSLARAFLLDRPILLLDEPVANVDAQSETIILDALDEIRPGKTCLAISHRPALVERADVVYRMLDGQVFEVADPKLNPCEYESVNL
ncbi:MAG: ABC transporter ATP-binding protein [bacterium]